MVEQKNTHHHHYHHHPQYCCWCCFCRKILLLNFCAANIKYCCNAFRECINVRKKFNLHCFNSSHGFPTSRIVIQLLSKFVKIEDDLTCNRCSLVLPLPHSKDLNLNDNVIMSVKLSLFSKR